MSKFAKKCMAIRTLSDTASGCSAIFCLIIWLAPRAGKMNEITRCDWLPKRARWSDLARSGLPAVSRKQNFPKSHIIILYWLSLFDQDGLILASFFFASLRTSTSSRSINTQKKNLANIQPSWPRTWSITHTNKCRKNKKVINNAFADPS